MKKTTNKLRRLYIRPIMTCIVMKQRVSLLGASGPFSVYNEEEESVNPEDTW